MYTHAHLRYAEACWRYGNVEAFSRLCLANPIGIRGLVPPRDPAPGKLLLFSSVRPLPTVTYL
jgi:hypothetical protein